MCIATTGSDRGRTVEVGEAQARQDRKARTSLDARQREANPGVRTRGTTPVPTLLDIQSAAARLWTFAQALLVSPLARNARGMVIHLKS